MITHEAWQQRLLSTPKHPPLCRITSCYWSWPAISTPQCPLPCSAVAVSPSTWESWPVTQLLELCSAIAFCPNLGASLSDIQAEAPGAPRRDPCFIWLVPSACTGAGLVTTLPVTHPTRFEMLIPPPPLFPDAPCKGQRNQHGPQNRWHTHSYTITKEGCNFLKCGNPNTPFWCSSNVQI